MGPQAAPNPGALRAPAAALLALGIAGCSRAGAADAVRNDGAPAAATASATASAAASATASAAATVTASAASVTASAAASADAPNAAASPAAVPWATRLAPILFRDVNTLADVTLRLYKDDGSIDEDAAAEVERVLWAAKDDVTPHVSRRLLQLVVKAAATLGVHEVQVISSHRGRARKGSRHKSGEAIDFVLPGVPPKKLAELLRTYPRVGVGVYVHPRSQFVHLDVREQSYHWIDGSPPGRSWREQPLPDPTAAARDAAYAPEQDLPANAG
jgi:uncharacterized protein YcbK (DUF882 family)